MFLVFFNSFSIGKCLVLFEMIFLLRLVSLVTISVFVAKVSCASLAAKLFVIKLLNSDEVMHLS